MTRKDMRRASRLLVGGLLVGAVVAIPSAAHAVQSAPRKSASIYVGTTSTTTAYNQGCSQGQADATAPTQDSEVVLDFGGQNSAGTGSILINGTVVTYAQIAAYAEQFARGYYVCTASDTTSSLLLTIGTNNSAYQVSSSGGAAWGNKTVQPARSWMSANSVGQVTVAGANDMEPGFGSAGGTVAWMQGYNGTGLGRLTNFGSADGCPQSSYSGGSCNNGWSQYTVWYVSWGNPSGFALPEIYYSANSKQWTMISRYGYYHQSGQIYYDGPMTEYGADGSYTSSQAWTQFWTDLNGSSTTSQSFSYRTDI